MTKSHKLQQLIDIMIAEDKVSIRKFGDWIHFDEFPVCLYNNRLRVVNPYTYEIEVYNTPDEVAKLILMGFIED